MSDELQQAKSLEERISFLEIEMKAVKDRLSKLEVPAQESQIPEALQASIAPAKQESKLFPLR